MKQSAAVNAAAAPHAHAPASKGRLLQRRCACGTHTIGGGECGECGKRQKIQRRPEQAGPQAFDEAAVHEVLQTPGRPLDSATRSLMESRFGHDLSRVRTTTPQMSSDGLTVGPAGDQFEQEAERVARNVARAHAPDSARGETSKPARHSFEHVRVHTDERAAQSARSVGALAYTVGNHVVFGAGQYAPATPAGRELLAHELVHTIQQGGARTHVSRACDPSLPPLDSRAAPIFFPNETWIKKVFEGKGKLRSGTLAHAAVGLVQQALVDLGYDLGASGRNKDGVDRQYGGALKKAVEKFQTDEGVAGATPGVVDQPTIKCLDNKRSIVPVQPHLDKTVQPEDVRVEGVKVFESKPTAGRDEDIYFDRGKSKLNKAGKKKIETLVTRARKPLKGCDVTLEGYVSEDELAEFGPALADERINEVDAEFVKHKHDDPGPDCPSPVAPLRKPWPLPGVSAGVSDYRSRRKVEVVPAKETSTTAPCPKDAKDERALTADERDNIVTPAVDVGVGWLNAAIAKLDADAKGVSAGDAAVETYFGDKKRRATVRKKLRTWVKHLDKVVRKKNAAGTPCNAVCRAAVAYNNGEGPSAMMTVCPRFFGEISIHTSLPNEQRRAFALMHEAGHGSLGTKDTAYGHRRLIEFLADYPDIALTNTDSFTLMILCLNAVGDFCSAPKAADTPKGLTEDEAKRSRRGLGWLQSWLTWTQQDTSSMYRRMNTARESGKKLKDVSSYYAGVYDVMVASFNIHRPPNDAPPTFGEQTFVSAVLDRLIPMLDATRSALKPEKPTSAPATSLWMPGPGQTVILADDYFALGTDRERVEYLLPLILTATKDVSSGLEPVYAEYIKTNVKKNWGNKPR